VKLPPNILQAMAALEHSAQADDWERVLVRIADLLDRLRRYHAEKVVDPESTHAMRRVSS